MNPLTNWHQTGLEWHGHVRHQRAEMRPVQLGDRRGWTTAMRANEDAMRPWWPAIVDWQRATDDRAFVHHLRSSAHRSARGGGGTLAILYDGTFRGEAGLWRRGNSCAEVGIWLLPGEGRTEIAGAFTQSLDRIMTRFVERLEAPVAAANPGPRGLLRLFGFTLEASIPRSRDARGQLVDYDYFGLHRDDWMTRRDRLLERVEQAAAATP